MYGLSSLLTSLQARCDENNADGVKRILSAVTIRQRLSLLSTRLHCGNTVLHYSAVRGHFGVVEKVVSLVDVSKRYKMVSQKNEDGFTVLHQAVFGGCVVTVRSVLYALSPEHQRTLIASKDINGKSALDYAVSTNRPDLSALLQSYTNQQTSSALKRRRSNTSRDRVKLLKRELERETAALSASSAELKELMETAAEQDRLLAASKAKSKLLDQQIALATQEIEKLRKLSPPVQAKHKRVKTADSRSGSNHIMDNISRQQVFD